MTTHRARYGEFPPERKPDAKDARIAELEARYEEYREASRLERDELEAEVARLREALHLQRRTYPHERYVPELLEALAGGGREPEAYRDVSAGGDYDDTVTVKPGWGGDEGIEATNPVFTSDSFMPRGNDGTDGLEDGHWLYEERAKL